MTSRTLLSLSLMVGLLPSLRAQSAGTGALTGNVTDPSGAAVPGVSVTATNVDTNQARTLVTGTDGGYKFSLLPPGTYRVKLVASGFKTVEEAGVTINVGETPVFNRTLEVGAQTEQITVESQTETIQTASSTLGTVVGSRSV